MDKTIDQTHPPKRGRLTRPRVWLMPNLRCVRVVKGEHGGEQVVGEHFPWHRVMMQSGQGGSSVWLRDPEGSPLKIRDKSPWVSMKNRANLAQRAQQRHILAWVRSSDEPITFAPKEASIWGCILLAAMMVPAMSYLYYQVISQFQHIPPQTNADWFAVVQFTILTIVALIMGRFLFIYRPRTQHFESVDLLPTGFVATQLTGEIISIDFDERSKPRLRRGDPLRLEFSTEDGQRMSFAVPKPLSSYLRAALDPPEKSQAATRREYTTRLFLLGIRIILFGILIVLGFYFFVAWLGRNGWILPQDVQLVQRSTLMAAVFPTMFGLQFVYVAWKYSKHGLRTRSRYARRSAHRKKEKRDADSTTGRTD